MKVWPLWYFTSVLILKVNETKPDQTHLELVSGPQFDFYWNRLKKLKGCLKVKKKSPAHFRDRMQSICDLLIIHKNLWNASLSLILSNLTWNKAWLLNINLHMCTMHYQHHVKCLLYNTTHEPKTTQRQKQDRFHCYLPSMNTPNREEDKRLVKVQEKKHTGERHIIAHLLV